MLRRGRLAVAVLVVSAAMLEPAAASGQSISLVASAAQITSGQPVRLSGVVTDASEPAQVQLWESPYPFRARTLVGTTDAGDGAYSFEAFPDRNTLYSTVLVNSPAAAASVYVKVSGRTTTKVKALPLGRARVVLTVFHPRDLRWGAAGVRWWFSSGHRARFVAARRTRSVETTPYATVLQITVSLPAGHFRWRACFHAPGDHALADPRRPPGCTGRGYHGDGYLPAGFPSPGAVLRAERYAAGRAGRVAFAVLDSEGRLSGTNLHERFRAASVVKAMLLVSYLRRLAAMGRRRVDSASNSFLYPMIHVSDNSAATRCWSIVGNGGLDAVARAAGMRDFSVTTDWLSAMISAADQARFFFEMDSLIPRHFVGYARFLLSTIDPSQSWGIPAVARPLGYNVFFKGGWLPNEGVINQVARLEGHHRTFAIAVLTLGPPGMSYGIDTIQSIGSALLR